MSARDEDLDRMKRGFADWLEKIDATPDLFPRPVQSHTPCTWPPGVIDTEVYRDEEATK